MKLKSIIISLFFVPFLASAQGANPEVVELPLTIHKGSGPFKKIAAFTPMIAKGSVETLPEASYPELTGISPRWGDEYVSGVIILDEAQYYNQLFNAGKISEGVLQSKLASLNVDPGMLSKNPVKCYVAFAYRNNPSGCVVVLDSNNNLDMSDDGTLNVVRPAYMMDIADENNPGAAPDYTLWVNFERVQNNQIVADSLPVSMIMPDEGDDLLYSIGIYGTAKLDNTQIGVAQGKLSSADFSNTVIVPNFDESKPLSDSLFTEGQVFSVGGNAYKLIKADTRRGMLMLGKAGN